MSDFNQALKMVLEEEGGFVDNPVDQGGPTNMGITMAAATDYLGGEPVSVAYIKALTPSIAGAIYRSLFWTPLRLDSVVDQNLATVVFNLAVLRGRGAMIHTLQRVLGVPVDGIFGPATIAKFLDAAHVSPAALTQMIIDDTRKQISDLVAENPSQKIFAAGWTNRLNALEEMVA